MWFSEVPRYHQRRVTSTSVLAIALAGFSAFAASSESVDADVSALARVGFSKAPSFSTDQKRVAFVSDVSGTPQVWLTPVDGGWPSRVTSLPDPVVDVHWSPSEDRIAFTARSGAGARTQLYLVSPDGTGLRKIASGDRDTNWWGTWSPDGDWLAFSSDRRNGSSMDVYRIDLASGETRLAIRNGVAGRVTDIADDRRRAAMIRTDAEANTQLLIVNLVDGGETSALSLPAPSTVRDAVFSRDGESLYIVTNHGRDRFGLGVLRFDDEQSIGAMEWLRSSEDADLDEVTLSFATNTAALLWNDSGRSALEFVDLESGETIGEPGLPQPVASGIVFSADGELLAMTLSGSTSPREIWLFDQVTGAFRRLTQTPDAGVDVAAFVSPQLVEYRSHDGLEIQAWLYRSPSGNRPGPLVLSFHDGPDGQERPDFQRSHQALLERGISVLAPNVRGSYGYGTAFTELDNGSLRANAFRDIQASVDYVVESGIAEPGRIGVMGAGYGGYMAMAALTQYPELFAAGVSVCGFYDLVSAPANLRPWAVSRWIREYGEPETQTDMLHALSPARALDRVRAPILFLHGSDDSLTPPAVVEQMVSRLQDRNLSAELLLFPGEARHIERTAHRTQELAAMVEWFRSLTQ